MDGFRAPILPWVSFSVCKIKSYLCSNQIAICRFANASIVFVDVLCSKRKTLDNFYCFALANCGDSWCKCMQKINKGSTDIRTHINTLWVGSSKPKMCGIKHERGIEIFSKHTKTHAHVCVEWHFLQSTSWIRLKLV